MVRIVIQVPRSVKAKLAVERQRGASTAGLIRHLLEQRFKGKKAAGRRRSDSKCFLQARG